MIIKAYIVSYKEKTTVKGLPYLTVCVVENKTEKTYYLTVFGDLIKDLIFYYKKQLYVYFKIKEVGNYKNVVDMSNYDVLRDHNKSYYPGKLIKSWGNFKVWKPS